MARRKAAAAAKAAPAGEAPLPGLARLAPTQQRSRERFERILACATEIMAEKGSEAFRMSDIVERSGVAFGSLYQYFPDKAAIIGTLAERHNAIGRDCVRRDLASVTAACDLHPALCRIVDSYHEMFMREPVMRDIWQATQADRALQKLDADDMAVLSALLSDAVRRVAPGMPAATLTTFSGLTMTLIAAAVRHAITLPPKKARQVLTQFKTLLPQDLARLT
ncbi:TetR/AcrR family transcriptional regulator [Bradyrhizobium septentrionale]|uniref:TetR family transcriptional regulator n=1 Tax=Bradyrhizobium septentrionale TaxID=1404411 RepID=A0A973W1J5_9BRAD|nr:TetR family transcriptional regulator [Bradyrhizobium septentrionale]UGY14229.1 TetR family transcriptional regulator [Bradyrhizobium septentrionale]UGY23070.1 TetR family transcriptional regulator [Bradyrhizobium septentrionale]